MTKLLLYADKEKISYENHIQGWEYIVLPSIIVILILIKIHGCRSLVYSDKL